ncbi:MAG: hypothetical protein ACREOH_23175, partial [Candidatus Entotheonellia bacterium]
MNELRLEVTEFTDVDHWRWRLTDTHGAFKADHQVAMNQADPDYEASEVILRGVVLYEVWEHEAEVAEQAFLEGAVDLTVVTHGENGVAVGPANKREGLSSLTSTAWATPALGMTCQNALPIAAIMAAAKNVLVMDRLLYRMCLD